MIFSIRPSKVLQCAECVTCASERDNAEKVRVRLCSVYTRSDCYFVMVNSKKDEKNNSTLSDLCRSNQSPWACVLPCVQDEDVVGYCDCRHVCDDEEYHHEDLDEGDHVHEDRDDHCSASGTEDCLVMFLHFHFTNCLYSRCSSVFTVSLPPSWKGCTTLYWSLQ